MKRRAVAVREAAHKFFETMRTDDDLAHFDNFPGGEFFPARADGCGLANTAEEGFDFGERETHFTSEADEENAVERFGRVAALAAGARGRREQADFFVITNGGRI